MAKPWDEKNWLDNDYSTRLEALYQYLKACPGWTVHSHELYGKDDELSWAIDETGGLMWACRHGVISSPNRPCDVCCQEYYRTVGV